MSNPGDRARLQALARRFMLERGLCPDYTPDALAELGRIREPARPDAAARDLRALPWCSLDNDDSRDLDQLTVAESLAEGAVRARVAIADVDALVPRGSALDRHAHCNTTSVYTAGAVFPMLPEKLSTDLTSLGYDADRMAMVVEMTFGADGALRASALYRASVRNRAKLAYPSVGAWLEGEAAAPVEIARVPGLADNLGLQDALARKLRQRRQQMGALDLETIETYPVFAGGILKDLVPAAKNRAKNLIEDFMIAANGVGARLLAEKGRSSLRRVVRTPKHWDRIVEIASERGASLPAEADPAALQRFLSEARAKDPVGFPDLSLCVIKLLGSGEYVVERPGAGGPGHFGLAVRDYAHSTAPNRRYPDLATQRLLKAAVAGRPPPYRDDELEDLARHCTEAEDVVRKVERQAVKSAAALLLESRVGSAFDAIVTGATEGGTWVRILHPPVEGKLVEGAGRLAVGRRLRVKLVATDVERGHIDFKNLNPAP